MDFEVRHISSQKHTASDGLSRRSPITADKAKAEAKKDIDDFILAELNTFRVSLYDPIPILADKYSDDSQKIATYLTTLRRPPEMDTKEFNAFKKKFVKFKV